MKRTDEIQGFSVRSLLKHAESAVHQYNNSRLTAGDELHSHILPPLNVNI